nr:MAG TPA: hypothetical protein [Caudoviricetes sp.]
MYSYYLERGIPHFVIDALNDYERSFYIANMLYRKEKNGR